MAGILVDMFKREIIPTLSTNDLSRPFYCIRPYLIGRSYYIVCHWALQTRCLGTHFSCMAPCSTFNFSFNVVRAHVWGSVFHVSSPVYIFLTAVLIISSQFVVSPKMNSQLLNFPGFFHGLPGFSPFSLVNLVASAPSFPWTTSFRWPRGAGWTASTMTRPGRGMLRSV